MTQHGGILCWSLACYWYDGDISVLPRLFWLSSLSSFAYITRAVMDRCPGGSWYGKLDILWFVKGFFCCCYYYYRPLLFMSLSVNTFKTASALLVTSDGGFGQQSSDLVSSSTFLAGSEPPPVCHQDAEATPSIYSPSPECPSAAQVWHFSAFSCVLPVYHTYGSVRPPGTLLFWANVKISMG